jgi:SAM-dependent methyltransferase
MSRLLDLGCGNRKRPGAVGVDINDRTAPDVIHDLNVFPYPFSDSSFDEIYLDNVLEHLDDVIRVMEEVYRISAPGASVKVIVPYFRSHWACIDPTHRHFFTVDSFGYFDPEHILGTRYKYTTAKFTIEKIIFCEFIMGGYFKELVKRIANKWPGRYETRLSHFYPLDDIAYYLRTLK